MRRNSDVASIGVPLDGFPWVTSDASSGWTEPSSRGPRLLTLPLPTIEHPYLISDVADEEPVRVYVRCNAPAPWEDLHFQGVIEDRDRIEVARSSSCANRVSMIAWLVFHDVDEDRASWLVENILRYAREHASDGATDLE